ncbi:WD domain, G-beta repeat protein, partial [Dictyocaulus viviparus]
FSNLIGSVYRNGNVIFSPDGSSVISPVGNKISVFDLKNNVSRTLSFDSLHNITAMAINNTGSHMIVSNEGGHVLYINASSETVIFKFRANRTVRALQFSPDGNFIAICRDMDLQIQEIGRRSSSMYYPFYLYKTYKLSTETLYCVDWSSDGWLVFLVGEIFILVDGLLRRKWTKPDKETEVEDETFTRLYYDKTKRYSLLESSGSGKTGIDVTSSRLHVKSNILVTAFSNGVFVLHEVPSFALIHNLRVSEMKISTVAINNTGDWLALGCGKGSAAQLVVWEWQSETYVLKQQAHSERILTAQYSPDGSLLATGAEDGKVTSNYVKIWNVRTAFCTVTFDEHTSAVTGVCWTQSGKAILSASLDGTVRAHDLKRYRNFRTLVCPEPTQLGSLAVDQSGDIVVAAAKEAFQIFVWSMESGSLLDILSGHRSNIAGISMYGNVLASVSWDRTLKMWNIVDSTCETVELMHEGLSVSFSPCGQLLAVLTIDSNITFYHGNTMEFVGSINAKLDLDPSRGQTDLITRQNAAQNKSFTCMQFSPDSVLLLLGGDSNNVCLYSVRDRILVKKFHITENRSLDGVVLDVNRRNFTEFGNMALCDTSDSEAEPDGKRKIQLPGSKHFDLGERSARPYVAVYAIAFCPTGRRFAICNTEGVSVYSLDVDIVFDPFHLDTQTTPAMIKRAISLCDYSTALMASLRLNESSFIQRTLESTEIEQIELVVQSLPLSYAEKLLKWIADGQVVASSPHVHFYMIWLRHILYIHGMRMKGRTDVAVLTGIQQMVAHHNQLISRLADQNKFGLQYILAARKLHR